MDPHPPTIPVDRSAPYLEHGRVQALGVQRGTRQSGEAWARYSIKVNDRWHHTFTEAHRELANAARTERRHVWIEFAPTKFGREILQIVISHEKDYRP